MTGIDAVNLTPRREDVPGCVELVTAERIAGWLDPRADGTFPLVDIELHGHRIRALRVREVLDDGRGRFSIPLVESLLRYVPGPGGLRFFADGVPLPVLVDELPVRPDALGADVLAARLAEGFFVTKFGGLRLPLELDTAWQERTFAHYAHARGVMRELFDLDVHVAYGTLLGIVREGAFIDGDDDFDATYHSPKTSPRAVRDELFEIATTLAARGEDVQLSGRKFLHWYGRGTKLDLFPSWSRGESYFQAHVVGGPYAHVFAAGFQEIEFKGRTVSRPVDAEGALAATYGPGWRTPDPLFQWRIQPAARRAMRRLRLTPGQLSLVQWERHYAGRGGRGGPSSPGGHAPGPADDGAPHGPRGPSPFAHLAAGMLGRRITGVVDLGCGDGRDTRTVAGDHPALGLDGSRAAIATAKERASDGTRFARLDVGDARALRRAIAPLTGTGPVAVYARRLLEAVEESAEATVRRVLTRTLRPGSLVILEVTTHTEPPPPLGTPLHRTVHPPRLVRRWTRDGCFTVQLLEHDTASQVARIVLRRRGPVARRAAVVLARTRRAAARLLRRAR